MSWLESVALAAAFAILVGVVGSIDFTEAEQEEVRYCEMVKLWKQTGGKQGWPAYDGERKCGRR